MTTTYDIIGGPIRVAGLAELEPTPNGVALHRLPAWARARHNDLALSLLEAMPSGARLELETDATELELDVHLTLIDLGEDRAPAATFDLVVDGTPLTTVASRAGTLIVIDPVTGAIDFRPGGPTTVRFTLPAGFTAVEIWLPHAAATQLIALRANGVVRAPTPRARRRWVHYGSSISHCLEAERPLGVWPVVASRRADVDLQSFAFAGQCQLDPFAGRALAEHPVDLVSMKLGINIVNGDTMRERTFVPAVHGLLDAIRDRHPDVPIVVITPITCPAAEEHPGPTITVDGQCAVVARPAALATGALTLTRIRELEREIVASRRADDPNLHLVEGPELFGPDDVADLDDGLHPNAAGYERMGERFHTIVFGPGGPFAPG